MSESSGAIAAPYGCPDRSSLFSVFSVSPILARGKYILVFLHSCRAWQVTDVAAAVAALAAAVGLAGAGSAQCFDAEFEEWVQVSAAPRGKRAGFLSSTLFTAFHWPSTGLGRKGRAASFLNFSLPLSMAFHCCVNGLSLAFQ